MLSLGWMTLEGAVAIVAGLAASSIALVGFARGRHRGADGDCCGSGAQPVSSR